MLNDMEMRKLRSKEDKESVIAHELAHVYLDHKVFDSKDIEQEADDLIKSWGFNPKIDTKHKR
jgi:hypothetical protein